MKENFEKVKEQVRIENIAQHLLGQPIRGMYRYPNEKTPSIKIYPGTQSFYDFGRAIGGDVVRLWSYIKGCDNWTALQELSAVFGISTALNETDKENIAARIKAQETARKEREQAEKRKQRQWIAQVNKLHEELELYDNLLSSPHILPMSWIWTWCVNGKQMTEHQLDCLCKVYN
jgi:hypothetical protein